MTTASAPASSANLGPGYDVLAVALDLRCTVEAEPSSEWSVTTGGAVASRETESLVRGVSPDGAPHAVDIESRIPQAKGLGSSAALLVAAAAALRGSTDEAELTSSAVAIEGHPDNVAAAVHGGLVAARPDGGVERLGVHPSFRLLLAVPDEVLPTSEARAVLAESVPREVAVRTAARTVMLIEGLRTADRDRLHAALGDELHEAPRAGLTETPGRLIDRALAAGAAFAAWSGAGPSVIAFVAEDDVDEVLEGLQEALTDSGEVIELDVDREGVRIE